MTTISDLCNLLETWAPLSLQENYDNAGLLTGNPADSIKGILISLDCTETIVDEAIAKNCNVIVAHHPIIFTGIKKLNGKNYIERTIIKAIKNDIAIYAIHTNLDNVIYGINGTMADKLGLINRSILRPKLQSMQKIAYYVPSNQAETVSKALWDAGAGHIGNYDSCAFHVLGEGNFRPLDNSNPYIGKHNQLQTEKEIKTEMVFPSYLKKAIIKALLKAHPYEEVAYNIVTTENNHPNIGAGIYGDLPQPMPIEELMKLILEKYKAKVVRHSILCKKNVSKVALCGGAGSFLIPDAKAVNADIYITSDLKYHEFFDADSKIILCDIGHYESEWSSKDLLFNEISKKCTTFAVQKSDTDTNPINYYTRYGNS